MDYISHTQIWFDVRQDREVNTSAFSADAARYISAPGGSAERGQNLTPIHMRQTRRSFAAMRLGVPCSPPNFPCFGG
jgi:hypothetical protein